MSAVIKEFLPEFYPMNENDLGEVLDIELSAYTHPWTLTIFQDCLQVGYCCWVMIREFEIIGYGIMSVGAGECHLLNLCVKPDWQNKGYGKLLLDHLLNIARDHRAETAFLEVRPSNNYAIQLYQKAGFVEVGTRQDYYPAIVGREDAIVLAKYLPGN